MTSYQPPVPDDSEARDRPALSSKEPIPQPLPPLPPLQGPARAVLMLVHPRRVFLYWVKDEVLEASLACSGRSAQLRVEVSADDDSFEEAGRHVFDFYAPGWYLPISRVDCLLRVRLGIQDDGEFRPLLLSNTLRIPREGPGDQAELRMDLEAVRKSPLRRAARQAQRIRSDAPARSAGRIGTSPGGEAPWHPRAAPRQVSAEERKEEVGAATEGSLAIVLHAHLPFVRHPEREYFLEENWLFEAITETYLPLLDLFEHLVADRVPARVTLSLTPTLMAMLRDPVLTGKYQRHLEKMCELAAREVVRTRRDPLFSSIAGFYRDRLERFRSLFIERYGCDLVSQFARLEAAGLLEIIASAATHGFLPNLATSPEAVWPQIAVGVSEHRRQLGRQPRGFWIPECAYFEGLDSLLARAGIEYFFVDSHAVRNASARPLLDLYGPLFCPAGVAAFPRDEESSVQVWSAEEGYPGDPTYRDFYRDIGFDLEREYVAPFLDPAGIRGMTGFKYHQITGRTDQKEPYRRDWALRTAARHAQDFNSNRRLQMRHLSGRLGRPPLVVAMYDAELFGHWWFEGPEWLEGVLRGLASQGIRAVSPGQYLADHAVGQVAEPAASSWGDGGYYEVWLNPATDWVYPHLHDAARRMAALASRAPRPGGAEERVLAQAGRELLLAQASDWPFILRNQTALGYARLRLHGHLDRFNRLARQLEEGHPDVEYLEGIEASDNLFPELDYRIWGGA